VGAQQLLVAYIVPEGEPAPSFDDLRNSLRKVLPAYMVPARFALLGNLPMTVGGKLNRRELPVIEAPAKDEERPIVHPRNVIEERLAGAISRVLGEDKRYAWTSLEHTVQEGSRSDRLSSSPSAVSGRCFTGIRCA
jgi:hypothetical protein